MVANIPINKNNLVRFYTVTSPSLAGTVNYTATINNGYLYRWKNQLTYIPILKGDTFIIYTNFLEDELGAGDVFRVIKNNTVINDATQYVVTSTLVGDYNYKIVLNIPSTNNDNDTIIRLGIVSSGGVIKYETNCLIVRTLTEPNIRGTHLLRFQHNSDIYGYDWREIVDPYTIRLQSNMVGYSYPKEDAVYRSATSGRTRTTRTIIDKKYNFETYWLDEDGHDGFNLLAHSKLFSINGEACTVDGEYEIGFNVQMNIAKGTLGVLVKNYSSRLNQCTDIVIPPPPPDPEPDPPVLTYLNNELSGDPEVYIDCNLRIFVNEIEIDVVFGDGGTDTVILSDGDVVRAQYFHFADLGFDEGVTNPKLQLIVEEDGIEIINEVTEIESSNITLNESFTVNNESVYFVHAFTFDDV
jgi:hypothetical protein